MSGSPRLSKVGGQGRSGHFVRPIRASDVHRFKGQQAAAVVLVDVDPDPASLELEQRRLFCGMTRATVKLDLLVRAGNPFTLRFLEAGS